MSSTDTPQQLGTWIYSNSASLHVGNFELTIGFFWNGPQCPVADPVWVTLSWNHAKKLASMLSHHLSLYEELFGEIPSDTPSQEKYAELREKGIIIEPARDGENG